MGYEIKNICTIAPNPHREIRNDEDRLYYYFSVFITPRLQFDGTLKEFYEMLNWPEYAQRVFGTDTKTRLQSVSLFTPEQQKMEADLVRDDHYLVPLCRKMDKLKANEEPSEKSWEGFFEKSKKLWRKIFNEKTPVEAWPIYIKPQLTNQKIERLTDKVNQLQNQIDSILKRQPTPPTSLDPFSLQNRYVAPDSGVSDQVTRLNRERTQTLQELDQEKKKVLKEKLEASRFRQEFHKKISALARYPHLLRVLGLIHDFKILKTTLTERVKNNPGYFSVKLNFDLSVFADDTNEKFPGKEFLKSVQFITPYTRCSLVNAEDIELQDDTLAENIQESRLRAFYAFNMLTPDKPREDYRSYVKNGFLNISFTERREVPDAGGVPHAVRSPVNVFEVDQDYFEDRSAEFAGSDQMSTSNGSTNVVGINTKVFSDEDVQILKQKVSSQSKASKGFAIKVHSQPGNLLTGMDEKLKELSDENIEDEQRAFTAHQLDCGYRVDVMRVTKNVDNPTVKPAFTSLCRRKANYIIDPKERTWLSNLVKDYNLFEALEDEPWLEEVRQVDSDAGENRFEEVSRWNNWSLVCPPLYNNKSAPNPEADDLELNEIEPIDLPELRYGQQYEYHFRIRTVDICGNGVPFDSNVMADYDPAKPHPQVFKAGSYQRFEPMGAPLFFPTERLIELDSENNAANKIVKKFKGEDNETLVLRSWVSKNGIVLSDDQPCIRFITPQYVAPSFAELSGLYDTTDVDTLYELLKKIPQYAYQEDEIISGIPFCIDSLVEGFFVTDPEQKEARVSTAQFKPAANPLTRLPVRLSFGKVGDVYQLSGDMDKPVTVDQGQAKYLNIQSFRNAAVQTNLPELSAQRQFRIIHAVQRPVFRKDEMLPGAMEKDSGTHITNLAGIFSFEKITPDASSYQPAQQYETALITRLPGGKKPLFPFSTTGEIVVTAAYHDYVLNPFNEKGWSYISIAYPLEKAKKEKSSTTDPDQADTFILRKSWSNLDETTENDRLDTILSDTVEEEKVKTHFNSFRHQFPDTRFRKVNYTMEAISKYSEFFDADAHKLDSNDRTPFSLHATLDISHGDGQQYTIIKNSHKPSKPGITAVIPIFTTIEEEDSYQFQHKEFRVYLGKTWFETGLGEKLAVVYRLQNPADDIPELKNKISVIANDPTTENTQIYDSTGTNLYIDSARVPKDSINLRIIGATLDSLKNAVPVTPGGLDPNYHPDLHEEGFSAFEVHWDMDRQQFYADIVIKDKELNHYSSLLKFAVCRYQEHSIVNPGYYDYRFSDIVMTDMLPLLPQRTVTINTGKKCIVFNVHNQRGGRYGINSEIKPNEIYLISEKKVIGGQIGKISDDPIQVKITKLAVIDHPTLKEKSILATRGEKGPIVIDRDNYQKDFSHQFLEEYEHLSVADGFSMNEETEGYNPRHDPRKRLIFFYKLR